MKLIRRCAVRHRGSAAVLSGRRADRTLTGWHLALMHADAIPTIRIARPARDLAAATSFYARGLGFEILASFEDHAGFDGVILGHPDWPYHFEFTHQPGNTIAPRPTEEDLIVFYLPEREAWETAVQRAREHGGRVVRSSNPYWEARGVTIEDPDGYRIVFENAAWP